MRIRQLFVRVFRFVRKNFFLERVAVRWSLPVIFVILVAYLGCLWMGVTTGNLVFILLSTLAFLAAVLFVTSHLVQAMATLTFAIVMLSQRMWLPALIGLALTVYLVFASTVRVKPQEDESASPRSRYRSWGSAQFTDEYNRLQWFAVAAMIAVVLIGLLLSYLFE